MQLRPTYLPHPHSPLFALHSQLTQVTRDKLCCLPRECFLIDENPNVQLPGETLQSGSKIDGVTDEGIVKAFLAAKVSNHCIAGGDTYSDTDVGETRASRTA